MKKWTYIIVLFILSTTISTNWSGHQYLIFVVSVVLFFYWGAIKFFSKFDKIQLLASGLNFTFIDLIPAILILVWLYGVVLGVLLGNNLTAITRNFAGMIMYLVYYMVLFSGIGKFGLIKTVNIAAWINVGIAFLFSWTTLASWGEITELGLLGFRGYISPGLSVICVYLSMRLFVLLSNERKSESGSSKSFLQYLGGYIGFFVASFALVAISISKGFILAFLFIIIFIPCLIVARGVVRFRINYLALAYIIIIGFLIGYGFSTDMGQLVTEMFDSNQEGNAVRAEQAVYLTREFSWMGSGLGAKLESGFIRDEMGYGFELTYHNVIHKFGLCAGIIFFSYAYTLFISIKNILKNKEPIPSVVALGAMAFLIPAYGNPLLFAPVSVVLHCLALFWLRNMATLRNVKCKL
jgi:hypothetical protein